MTNGVPVDNVGTPEEEKECRLALDDEGFPVVHSDESGETHNVYSVTVETTDRRHYEIAVEDLVAMLRALP